MTSEPNTVLATTKTMLYLGYADVFAMMKCLLAAWLDRVEEGSSGHGDLSYCEINLKLLHEPERS